MHLPLPHKNQCPKCDMAVMKPKYQAEGNEARYVDKIDEVSKFITISKTVKTEFIIWTCPECSYRVAKGIKS